MMLSSGRCVRRVTVVAGVAAILAAGVVSAAAQDISINLGGGEGGGLTERVIQLIALLTVLSLAPSILVMMTCFTRIVVVLSLLRTALGTATAPPNAVIVSFSPNINASGADSGYCVACAVAEQVNATNSAMAGERIVEAPVNFSLRDFLCGHSLAQIPTLGS